MDLSTRTFWSLGPPLDIAARSSRDHVVDACLGLPEDLTATAELLVHEIVVNAFLHGSGHVVLAVERDSDRIRVQVRDENPQLPIPQDRGLMAESGRGLHLVAALARQWGALPDTATRGKWVWFEV